MHTHASLTVAVHTASTNFPPQKSYPFYTFTRPRGGCMMSLVGWNSTTVHSPLHRGSGMPSPEPLYFFHRSISLGGGFRPDKPTLLKWVISSFDLAARIFVR